MRNWLGNNYGNPPLFAPDTGAGSATTNTKESIELALEKTSFPQMEAFLKKHDLTEEKKSELRNLVVKQDNNIIINYKPGMRITFSDEIIPVRSQEDLDQLDATKMGGGDLYESLFTLTEELYTVFSDNMGILFEFLIEVLGFKKGFCVYFDGEKDMHDNIRGWASFVLNEYIEGEGEDKTIDKGYNIFSGAFDNEGVHTSYVRYIA